MEEKTKTPKKKIVIIGAAGVLVVVLILFFAFRGTGSPTQTVRDLPEQPLSVRTADGEVRELIVKNASHFEGKQSGFTGVASEVVGSTVLFVATQFSATSEITVSDLEAPIDIAFFSDTGEFMEISRFVAGVESRHRPEGRYKYILEARAGFLTENGIGPGSSLVL